MKYCSQETHPPHRNVATIKSDSSELAILLSTGSVFNVHEFGRRAPRGRPLRQRWCPCNHVPNDLLYGYFENFPKQNILLDRAPAEGRVLVSHDRRTMIDHFRDHLAAGKPSPGLLIVSQGSAIVDVRQPFMFHYVAQPPGR